MSGNVTVNQRLRGVQELLLYKSLSAILVNWPPRYVRLGGILGYRPVSDYSLVDDTAGVALWKLSLVLWMN